MTTVTEAPATEAPATELLTLPEVSLRAGIPLDKLRREAARNSALGELLVRAGHHRLIRACDLDRVKVLLGVKGR